MHFRNLAPHPDIGANLYQLTFGDTQIVLDAGVHPKHIGRDSLPLYNLLKPGSVDAVLVSHPHLDHIGSLPLLARHHPEAVIAMTEPTRDCGIALLHNSVNVMKAQRKQFGETSYPLFSHRELDQVERAIHCRAIGQEFSLGERDRVRCEFHHAGHVLGAIGMRLSFEDHTLFYTGDVHFENQTLTSAASFPEDPVDTLIMETTRGDSIRPAGYTREAEKQRFGRCIAETLDRGGAVLTPVFAFGKTQEVITMIRELMEEGAIPEVPVHIGGLSTRMASLADGFADDPRRLHSGFRLLHDFRPLRTMPRGRLEPDFRPGEIYTLSSGMMTEKTVSNRFARHILRSPEHALLFVGYADKDSPAGRILATAPGEKVVLDANENSSFRLRCQVEKFDFSGHAPREKLLAFATRCRPKTIILVHGDPAAREWFRGELARELPATRVVIPQPGEKIALA